MAQTEVIVSAPGNRRKRWRLPDDRLIGLLIPTIVERMGLPTEISWNLVSPAQSKSLAEDNTLAKEKVRPGTGLVLEPVRNTLFKKFLEALYEEAEGNVQDKLWDKAVEKLQELHEYDPRFPDPKGLRQLAGLGLTPSAVPAAGVSWGLVVGGLAIAGTLAVGAVAVTGGAALLIYQAAQQEERYTPFPPPTESPGGGGAQPHTGDVQVTLEWYDTADLDLHVRDPNGDEVYFGNTTVPSGGELDVDANHPCGIATSSPLENVYWPWGGAPSGEYDVVVVYYGECYDEGTVEYQVTVRVDGDVLGTYSGAISPGGQTYITGFER